jgi:hypothetical protein
MVVDYMQITTLTKKEQHLPLLYHYLENKNKELIL